MDYVGGTLESLLDVDESRAAEHVPNQIARDWEVIQARQSGQVWVEAQMLS